MKLYMTMNLIKKNRKRHQKQLNREMLALIFANFRNNIFLKIIDNLDFA